jgi:hypothetical protein
MARIYDQEFDMKEPQGEEIPENKALLADLKATGKKLADAKDATVKVEVVPDEDVEGVIEEEVKRTENKGKKSAKTSKPPKAAKKASAKTGSATKKKASDNTTPVAVGSGNLIFPQFSREVEYFHYLIQNRRTKQSNVITTEYQDCFGNAKVHFVFDPENKTDQNIAKVGLNTAIEQLAETGAVSIFATAPVNQVKTNEVFSASGFRNTGWLTNQILTPSGPVDVILWTKKLI